MSQCPKCGAKPDPKRHGAQFCGACGTPFNGAGSTDPVSEPPAPNGPGVAAPTTDVESADLSLELNDNRFRMAGHAGVLDLRLTNIGDVPIRKGRLELVSRLLDEPFTFTFRLKPGQSIIRRAELEPRTGGDHLLNARVCCQVAGTWKAFCAQPTVLVLDHIENPEQMVVNIGELVKVNAAEGGKVLGVNIEANVADLVKRGAIRTANDLMTMQFPDRFQGIDLEYDYDESERLNEEEGARETKRLAPGFADRPAALSRAVLQWRSDGRTVNVGLLALPCVRFGRHRIGNDVVLRCLPRSETADARSMRISKDAHFTVTLTSDAQFVIRDDPPSRNGTTVNGQLVLGEHPIEPALYRPSRLDVASGALKLRLDFHPGRARRDEPYRPLMKDGEPPLWTIAGEAGLRGLGISRLDNLGAGDENGEERYAIVYRWVQIGASSGNAVVVRGEGVDEVHARLLHFDGGFWLEALSPTSPTKVDGRLIEQHALAPLAPGAALTLGDVALDFAEWRQLYL